MPGFSVNFYRCDPYKNFKFRILWDGEVIEGISKVSPLQRKTEPVVHRDGGEPNSSRVSPGTWSFEPITLERGVTHDTAFEEWADMCFSTDGDAAFSLANFRKNIQIQLLNEQGTVVKGFNVYRCWVSEYQVLPELDANSNEVAIESITLQNEGWTRDDAIREPSQT